MIPKNISPNFQLDSQKFKDSDDIVAGKLVCCSTESFNIDFYGKCKKHFFSKPYLIPVEDRIILSAHCDHCGKHIRIFDNSIDGYDHLLTPLKQNEDVQTTPFRCLKCNNNNFSVKLKYEYSATDESSERDLLEGKDYTWIWATLSCNHCGTVYRNFLDFETG